MSKYKINIDKPLPEPKVIKKYQNFDTLYDQYQVTTRFEFWRSLYRKPVYFAGMVAVFAILFLIFETVGGELNQKEFPFAHPPFPETDPEFSSILLNADSSLIYITESGSRVHFPAKGWVNNEKQPINGEIEIQVRELNTPADMFLAGVSSKYDSAENSQILASESMLEVKALLNGQPVYLAEGKNIEIDYFSYDTASRFAVYFLDTLNKNWNYQGEDEVELIAMADISMERPEMPQILKMSMDELRPKNMGILLPKPGKPFGVKVKNPENYAEFRGFEKVYWEFVPAENSANPWEEGLIGENSPWNDVRVKRLPRRGYYELQFARLTSGGNMQVKTVVASPLFEAKTEAQANSIYQANYRKWEEALAAREKELEEIRKVEQERREAREKYDKAVAEWEAAMSDTITDAPQTCYRKIAINQTGVFNLASKIPFPPANATIRLTNQEGKKIDNGNKPLYLVDEKVNAIFPATINEEGDYLVKFDPSARKAIWSSDIDNHILMVPSEKTSTLVNDSENVQNLIPEWIPVNHEKNLREKLLEQDRAALNLEREKSLVLQIQ